MQTRRTSAVLAVSAALILAGCSSNDDDKTAEPDLTSAPEASWSTTGGIAVPSSEDDGPSTDEPVAHGYAHTPQGAVLAAINGQTLLATADDGTWVAAANTVLTPGKGKDQWVQARALQTVDGTVRQAAEFVCFQVTDYSDDRAQVVLTLRWPDDKLTAQPTQLAWAGDDWRLVLPDQDNAVDAVEVESLDGCTEFSAETAD